MSASSDLGILVIRAADLNEEGVCDVQVVEQLRLSFNALSILPLTNFVFSSTLSSCLPGSRKAKSSWMS